MGAQAAIMIGGRIFESSLLVQRQQVIQGPLFGDDFDAVLVGLAAAGGERVEPAALAILVAAFDTAVGGFEGADVFVLAPVLPVRKPG